MKIVFDDEGNKKAEKEELRKKIFIGLGVLFGILLIVGLIKLLPDKSSKKVVNKEPTTEKEAEFVESVADEELAKMVTRLSKDEPVKSEAGVNEVVNKIDDYLYTNEEESTTYSSQQNELYKTLTDEEKLDYLNYYRVLSLISAVNCFFKERDIVGYEYVPEIKNGYLNKEMDEPNISAIQTSDGHFIDLYQAYGFSRKYIYSAVNESNYGGAGFDGMNMRIKEVNYKTFKKEANYNNMESKALTLGISTVLKEGMTTQNARAEDFKPSALIYTTAYKYGNKTSSYVIPLRYKGNSYLAIYNSNDELINFFRK